MPGGLESNTDDRLLPIDREAEALLAEVQRQGMTTEQVVALLEGPQAIRVRIGMARSYRRLLESAAEYTAERDELVREYDELIARRMREADGIDQSLRALAVNRRRQGLGNFFDVAGVGRWSTTSAPAHFKIDSDKVLGALEGDDLETFSQLEEPKKPERKLLRGVLELHLAGLIADQMEACTLEDEKERAAYQEGVAARVAAMFPGVEYVPEDINAKTDADKKLGEAPARRSR